MVLPVIGNNLHSPNLMTYFNADEGYLIDNVWFYYAGKKLPTYEMSLDYGLELVYIADIVRFLFGGYIDVTPGLLVLIVRWFHLLSWVGALVALWYLVKNHFGGAWQGVLVVFLVAVRPAFGHCMNSMRPEPLVLLILIIGFDHVLSITQNPHGTRHLLIAAACASLAFIVKFAGLFLLPSIVIALYLGHKYSKSPDTAQPFWFRNSWIFPGIISVPFVISPFIALFFYESKTSGLTHFQEFGFLAGLLKYKIIFLFWAFGTVLIAVCAALLLLNRYSKGPGMAKVLKEVNRINYHATIVTFLFIGFGLLFGFKWFVIPKHFLEVYAVTSLQFSGGEALAAIQTVQGYFKDFFNEVFRKIRFFDPLILFLLGIYAVAEVTGKLRGIAKADIPRYYKRLTLLFYLLPCLASVLSLFGLGRFARHNMLPFFFAAAILVAEGMYLCRRLFAKRRVWRHLSLTALGLIFAADLFVNASELLSERRIQFHQHRDIAFEIEDWLRANIPTDAVILADHPRYAYLPEVYKNAKFIKRNKKAKQDYIRKLIESSNPGFIYFMDDDTAIKSKLPPLRTAIPSERIELIKVFDNGGRHYQRWPDTKFFIYKVLR